MAWGGAGWRGGAGRVEGWSWRGGGVGLEGWRGGAGRVEGWGWRVQCTCRRVGLEGGWKGGGVGLEGWRGGAGRLEGDLVLEFILRSIVGTRLTSTLLSCAYTCSLTLVFCYRIHTAGLHTTDPLAPTWSGSLGALRVGRPPSLTGLPSWGHFPLTVTR